MRVAVVGLGVMGGSLARALREVRTGGDEPDAPADPDEAPAVVGWAAAGADREAAAADGVTVAESLADAVTGAEVVVLATPLSAVPGVAADIAAVAGPDTVVTDVASLQAPALRAAAEAGLAERWVTSHPLAGSERSGFGASRADLYRGVPVYLSAGPDSALHIRAVVASLWESVGAAPEWLDPEEHDRRMSLVSHLPQVVSAALADAIAATGPSAAALGPGGRDTTRLAASSGTMWRDLFAHADPSLAAALRDVAARLSEDAAALERGDPDPLVARLDRAGAWRRGS